MADTEQLGNMLDNLIDDKSDQAEVHFHDYLQGKMQEVINGTDDDEVSDITNKEQ